MSDNIHNGHRKRLKDRFLKEDGISSFSDHEVLELFLYYCIPQKDTNPIAHQLLNHFGGKFSAVFERPYHELLKVDDIGEHTALGVRLVAEMTRRLYEDKLDHSVKLDSQDNVYEYLKPRFIGLSDEHIYCLFLDNLMRPISCELVAKGVPNSVNISPRQVVEAAIKHRAVNIVLAHNHPQGLSVPSHSDVAITRDIETALNAMDMVLIDHFIMSKDDYASMKNGKWI